MRANKVIAGERETVNFTAIVNSMYNNNFAYKWQKKNKKKLPRKVSTNFNGAILIIPDVLKSDEGRYYCNVTNEWGTNMRSEEVMLSVEGKKSAT